MIDDRDGSSLGVHYSNTCTIPVSCKTVVADVI